MHDCHKIQGQGQNLSATGGVLAFLLGTWVGAVANQRYQIFKVQRPGFESQGQKDGDTDGERRADDEAGKSRADRPPGVKEGIEKLRALEKWYHQKREEMKQTAETHGSSSVDVAGNPRLFQDSWTSEWSE